MSVLEMVSFTIKQVETEAGLTQHATDYQDV